MSSQSVWATLRLTLGPALIMMSSPVTVHILAKFGHMERISMTWNEIIFGNALCWKMSFFLMFWAFLFLKLPAKQHYGPITPSGYIPRYQDNGFFYYVTTSVLFIAACYLYPQLPHVIYSNMVHLLSTLNVIALLLCAVLWLKGKFYPYEKGSMGNVGFIFEYYCGLEHHPRMFDVDVKQFTNCRFGMMVWQLIILTFWAVSYDKFGFNWGITASVISQTVYVARLYYFEYTYFNTLDVILDHTGFYMCWGCMVFIPGFFVFTTYYFVANPPIISQNMGLIALALGLICVITTFLIDFEKDVFRRSDGKRTLWSNKPKFIQAEHEVKGKKVKTKLLASGFWGVSRHLNYVFEVATYFAWALPGYKLGIVPFICPIFLIFLVIHRSHRDDDRCSKKYGAAWQQYCSLVKYKILPYVY